MTKATKNAVAKYGIENCRRAYALTLDGSGAGYVVACFDVHYRTADSMINAGRELQQAA